MKSFKVKTLDSGQRPPWSAKLQVMPSLSQVCVCWAGSFHSPGSENYQKLTTPALSPVRMLSSAPESFVKLLSDTFSWIFLRGFKVENSQPDCITCPSLRDTAIVILDASGFFCCCLVAQSCLTLLESHGLQSTRLLCPWDSPSKNSRVGCHALLQGIILTQGSN